MIRGFGSFRKTLFLKRRLSACKSHQYRVEAILLTSTTMFKNEKKIFFFYFRTWQCPFLKRVRGICCNLGYLVALNLCDLSGQAEFPPIHFYTSLNTTPPLFSGDFLPSIQTPHSLCCIGRERNTLQLAANSGVACEGKIPESVRSTLVQTMTGSGILPLRPRPRSAASCTFSLRYFISTSIMRHWRKAPKCETVPLFCARPDCLHHMFMKSGEKSSKFILNQRLKTHKTKSFRNEQTPSPKAPKKSSFFSKFQFCVVSNFDCT